MAAGAIGIGIAKAVSITSAGQLRDGLFGLLVTGQDSLITAQLDWDDVACVSNCTPIMLADIGDADHLVTSRVGLLVKQGSEIAGSTVFFLIVALAVMLAVISGVNVIGQQNYDIDDSESFPGKRESPKLASRSYAGSASSPLGTMANPSPTPQSATSRIGASSPTVPSRQQQASFASSPFASSVMPLASLARAPVPKSPMPQVRQHLSAPSTLPAIPYSSTSHGSADFEMKGAILPSLQEQLVEIMTMFGASARDVVIRCYISEIVVPKGGVLIESRDTGPVAFLDTTTNCVGAEVQGERYVTVKRPEDASSEGGAPATPYAIAKETFSQAGFVKLVRTNMDGSEGPDMLSVVMNAPGHANVMDPGGTLLATMKPLAGTASSTLLSVSKGFDVSLVVCAVVSASKIIRFS